MVIETLQQIIDERISFLKEQINPNNKPEVNTTFQLQIDFGFRGQESVYDKLVTAVSFLIQSKVSQI